MNIPMMMTTVSTVLHQTRFVRGISFFGFRLRLVQRLDGFYTVELEV